MIEPAADCARGGLHPRLTSVFDWVRHAADGTAGRNCVLVLKRCQKKGGVARWRRYPKNRREYHDGSREFITKNERRQLDDTTPRNVIERGLHLADPRCLGDEGRLVGVGEEVYDKNEAGE
ncbi:hypothetical protein I7I51_07426 [Histoplasma capsulatum]|uniref:Uncharacterized protein n=1 Tax=Ajellomyces capsulatus TaxID=5037 RepID=A0A8A1M1D6_AJECA|nr:hypothetical protein I7I51_07426 [Histoplasma capsulatum]